MTRKTRVWNIIIAGAVALAATILLGHNERVRDTNYINRESINTSRVAA